MTDSTAYIQKIIMSMEATDNLRLYNCRLYLDRNEGSWLGSISITKGRNTTTHKKHRIYTAHTVLQILALTE